MVATTYTNPSDMVSSGLQAYDTTTGAITGRTITGTAGQVTVTNGSGVSGNPTIALSSTLSGFTFAYTEPGAYPYNVATTDFMVGVDTTAARTIRLPNAPTTGSVWIIKDFVGNAAAQNISVTTVGGAVLIDSGATYTINVNYGSISLLFNGTKYLIW